MDFMVNYLDDRESMLCIYCGQQAVTRDHVPSKVLLDEPYPEQLPIVPSCENCNNSFSLDEEYFACLIECALHGSTDLSKLERVKIKRILGKRESLQKRIESSLIIDEGKVFFQAEDRRIAKIFEKLGKGHMFFEYGSLPSDSTIGIKYFSLDELTIQERMDFENNSLPQLLPEVGSRGLKRLFEKQDCDQNNWISVQKNRYRYRVSEDRVKVILSEFLASEIVWK